MRTANLIISIIFPFVTPFSPQRPRLQLDKTSHNSKRVAGRRRSELNLSAEKSKGDLASEEGGGIPPGNIAGISLVVAPNNDRVVLGTLLPTNPDETVVLACLSHFGDFNAWEVTQQYIAGIKSGDFGSGCKVVLVGIGSADAARQFAADLSLNDDSSSAASITLVADEKGAVTEELECYRGWLAIDQRHAQKWPATDVSPYVKLLGMIVGLGSPGTMEKVIYGYTGDRSGGRRSRQWVIDALLLGSEKGRWPRITNEAFAGIPIDSGLRPFELATLRAQTGLHIVRNWGKLGPHDGDLFTRMGGTFVFKGHEMVYSHYDAGILSYAPQCEVIAAAE